MCGCGCNTCETKPAVLLNESKAPKEILSEGLKYHLDNNRPLTDHLYRAGSTKYFELFAEARSLYAREILEFSGSDLEVLTETDLGHFGIYEGKKVPLDFPMLGEGNQFSKIQDIKHRIKRYKISMSSMSGKQQQAYYNAYIKPLQKELDTLENSINEAEFKGKDVSLNKPMRGGSKKFYVYVKDPKTKKIKKVSFGGTTGLKAKINDPEARRNFAKRHNCAEKKDKTKPGYWSCRLPRYSKLLGLKGSYTGFW